MHVFSQLLEMSLQCKHSLHRCCWAVLKVINVGSSLFLAVITSLFLALPVSLIVLGSTRRGDGSH